MHSLEHLSKKEKKEHYNAVASLGCVVCGQPADIHHCKRNPTFPAKRENRPVIPLCKYHHQDGGYGFAIHAGLETWERNFGTQEELMLQVWDKIGFRRQAEGGNNL